MDPWRKAWREIAPLLPVKGLAALADALLKDDLRLIQNETVSGDDDWMPTGACAIGFCYWRAEDLETMDDVFKAFMKCGQGIHDDSWQGWCDFVGWFDDTDRAEMRRLLLPEVNRSLALLGTISEIPEKSSCIPVGA